jgi:hypothetical protein
MFNKDHISTNWFNQNEKLFFCTPLKYTVHLLNITTQLASSFAPCISLLSTFYLFGSLDNKHIFSLDFLFYTCVAEIYILSYFLYVLSSSLGAPAIDAQAY